MELAVGFKVNYGSFSVKKPVSASYVSSNTARIIKAVKIITRWCCGNALIREGSVVSLVPIGKYQMTWNNARAYLNEHLRCFRLLYIRREKRQKSIVLRQELCERTLCVSKWYYLGHKREVACIGGTQRGQNPQYARPKAFTHWSQE